MNINNAISLANQMLSEHVELNGWIAATNRRKRAFGLCSYRKKEISLSSVLVPVMTDEAIKDTIIHEIAHALCPEHHHDRIWQRKCIELGGNGQRCGGDDKYFEGAKSRNDVLSQVSKYTLTCPSCGKKTYKSRKPKRDHSCGVCCSYYNPEFKLVLTENY